MITEFINSSINNQKSYLIQNQEQCVLIDVSTNINLIIADIKAKNLMLTAVIITHGHFDHIAGLKPLLHAYPDITIFINQWDEFWLYHYPITKHQLLVKEPITIPKEKFNVNAILGSTKITLIGYEFYFKHIPGHTPGSQYIIINTLNAAFIGDTIFATSIGFHNIPYCDDDYFKQSLQELAGLNKNYHIYPGHHQSFVLKDVLTSNEQLIAFLKS